MSDPARSVRDDVELVPEDRGAAPGRYYVRDPRTGGTFVLDEAAWFLWHALQSGTPRDAVLANYRERFGVALDAAQLDAFVHQLGRRGLLAAAPPPRTLPELFDGEAFVPTRRWPLFHADASFRRLADALGWAFTRRGQCVLLPPALAGFWVLPFRWPLLRDTLEASASVGFWVAAALTALFVVNALRAAAHGVACAHYGRQVGEAGVSVLFHVFPFAYVDWSDALWLPRMRERLWTIGAGLWVHGWVCGVALFIWSLTAPGSAANALALVVATGAGCSLVLFNGNPLVDMNAAQLLATWLERPHLRSRALAAFGGWLHGRPSEPLPARERRWFVVYGALCTAYVLGHVGVFLWIVGSHVAVDGLGALATIGLGAFLMQRPLGHYVRRLPPVRWWQGREPRTRRWLAALAVLLLLLLPYPYETGGPLTLLPVARTEVHAEVEGRIGAVFVKEGEHVAPGQQLAALERWEYETQRDATRQQLAAREADLRLVRAGVRPEEIERLRLDVERAAHEVARAIELVQETDVRLSYSESRATRYGQLWRDETISRQDWENAQRERDIARESRDVALAQREVAAKSLEVAQAQLAVAQSGPRPEQIESVEADIARLRTVLAGLETQLGLTTLASPVAGVVSTPFVEQKAGQFLRKGDLFAVIQESDRIQAEVRVPEEDVTELAPDARIRVVVWSHPGRTFEGRVLFMAPVASDQSLAERWRVVRVLTELPNADGLLRPAMTGYAKIASTWRPLGQVLLWPVLRWLLVQVWYWVP